MATKVEQGLGIFLFWLASSSSFAETAEPWVIGLEDINYYPVYSNYKGAQTGFIADLVELLSIQLAQPLKIELLPIQRLKSRFAQQQIVIKFPDNPNWHLETNKPRYYSLPVVPYEDGLVSLRQSNIQTLHQIGSLGTLAGFTLEVIDPVVLGRMTVERTSQVESLLAMLMAERVDAIYVNYLVIQNIEMGEPAPELDFLSHLGTQRAHFHFSSFSKDYVLRIDSFLRNSKEALAQLADQYDIDLSY